MPTYVMIDSDPLQTQYQRIGTSLYWASLSLFALPMVAVIARDTVAPRNLLSLLARRPVSLLFSGSLVNLVGFIAVQIPIRWTGTVYAVVIGEDVARAIATMVVLAAFTWFIATISTIAILSWMAKRVACTK